MRRRAAVAVLLTVALSGCSGGSSSGGSSPRVAQATMVTMSGKADAAALTSFSCHVVKGGSWTATGTLSNTANRSHSYDVAVLVSSATTGTATVQPVTGVASKGSSDFYFSGLAATGADPTCRVRVNVTD